MWISKLCSATKPLPQASHLNGFSSIGPVVKSSPFPFLSIRELVKSMGIKGLGERTSMIFESLGVFGREFMMDLASAEQSTKFDKPEPLIWTACSLLLPGNTLGLEELEESDVSSPLASFPLLTETCGLTGLNSKGGFLRGLPLLLPPVLMGNLGVPKPDDIKGRRAFGPIPRSGEGVYELVVIDGFGTLKSRETNGGIDLASGMINGLGPFTLVRNDLELSLKPDGTDGRKSIATHDFALS